IRDFHVTGVQTCALPISLNLIQPGCDFNAVALSDLDALFAYYTKLFAPLKLQIMRRAAWVRRSMASNAPLDYWLSGDTRAAMSRSAERRGADGRWACRVA